MHSEAQPHTAKVAAAPTLPFSRLHLTPGTRVAVAVSGGVDSVALLRTLHAANQLPRESLGVGLSVIHVHHGLRGESADRDQQFVTGLCEDLDLPLMVRSVNTRAHAAEHRETVEEAARTLRYGVFRDLLTSGHADVVATAHTLEDQAETVLLKLLRGAWTEGLGGIYPVVDLALSPPAVSGPQQTPFPRRTGQNSRPLRIVRPLLATSRAEIEGFLQALNQPWTTDETNLDPAHTRNRLRHELLPALRAFNPALDTALAHLASIARDEEAHWQAELARLLPQLLLPGQPVRGGGRAVSTAADAAEQSLSLDIERLRTLSVATRRRVLRSAARRLGARLRFEDVERLETLCGFIVVPAVPSRSGSAVDLPGVRAERSARELRLAVRTITS